MIRDTDQNKSSSKDTDLELSTDSLFSILADESDKNDAQDTGRLVSLKKIFEGKYEIVRKIGNGGMGDVYEAHHIKLKNKVAIKVMHEYLVHQDKKIVERFEQEALASAKISHPNAVKVIDYGTSKNICYLIMEYLEGESLRERLNKRKKLPFSEVVKIVEQICYVLESLHRKDIIHRDLKPENIFICKQEGEEKENIKVLDFGLAKSNSISQQDKKLTAQGTLLGTPYYMSPEQWQGANKIDSRSDLYSLGVIIFEMLTGRLPFEADSPYALMFKHVQSQPPSICDIAPEIHQKVNDIVMKLLAKKPENRCKTAKEFLQEFSLLSSNPSIYLQILDRNAFEQSVNNVASRKKFIKAKKYFLWILSSVLLVIIVLITSQQFNKIPTTSLIPMVTIPNLASKNMLNNFVLIKSTKAIIGADLEDCQKITSLQNCKIEDWECPSHSIILEDYYISKYEVTNKEYQEFVLETGHNPPSDWKSGQYIIGTEDFPVVQVSWDDAMDYCNWRSKKDNLKYRLPTEEEWEYAARGSQGTFFPWGNYWNNLAANVGKAEGGSPLSIYKNPNNTDDVTISKIFAMAGNVAEWTASEAKAYENSKYKFKTTYAGWRVIKGGAFDSDKNASRTTYRSWQPSSYTDKDIGFRLAVTP